MLSIGNGITGNKLLSVGQENLGIEAGVGAGVSSPTPTVAAWGDDANTAHGDDLYTVHGDQ